MGNRATIVFESEDRTHVSPAVYLHWNGGPESVYAFLAELDRRKVRADQCYEVARFIQLVGEFFDVDDGSDGLSLGLFAPPKDTMPAGMEGLNHGDNGSYAICRSVKPMRMRRFISQGFDREPREMSPEDVLREAQTAKADDYAQSFAETFDVIRKRRSEKSVPA